MDAACAPQSPDLSCPSDNHHHHHQPRPQHDHHLRARRHYNTRSSSALAAAPAARPPPPQQLPPPPPHHRPMLHSQPAPQPCMPRGPAKHESMQDAEYVPDASLALTAAPGAAHGLGGADTPATQHITIKNHFPVARIKRIMQADDDVGKVAQVTPVVVCT